MGLRETLGIEIEEASDGTAVLAFFAREEHLNDGGILHGGAIATLVDCAMGSALASTLEEGRRPVTVECKVNYLEAGREGRIVANGKVRRKGGRFTVLEAEVYQADDGTHIAYATATFTLIDG